MMMLRLGTLPRPGPAGASSSCRQPSAPPHNSPARRLSVRAPEDAASRGRTHRLQTARAPGGCGASEKKMLERSSSLSVVDFRAHAAPRAVSGRAGPPSRGNAKRSSPAPAPWARIRWRRGLKSGRHQTADRSGSGPPPNGEARADPHQIMIGSC
eukprot:scaffold1387_cov382-Prasinococcus_capsulatus_cf.AAC.7